MLVKLIIISVVLLIISLILLGLGILLKNNGQFPQFHISRNREMRKRGIACGHHSDIGCDPSYNNGSCSTCGKDLIS